MYLKRSRAHQADSNTLCKVAVSGDADCLARRTAPASFAVRHRSGTVQIGLLKRKRKKPNGLRQNWITRNLYSGPSPSVRLGLMSVGLAEYIVTERHRIISGDSLSRICLSGDGQARIRSLYAFQWSMVLSWLDERSGASCS